MQTFSLDRFFGKTNRFYFMGIAIILIFFFHLDTHYADTFATNAPAWLRVFDQGYLGVDIFFILSSFGLTISLDKYTEKPDYKQFYLNRFKRIYPYYICYLVLLSLSFLYVLDKTMTIRLFSDNLLCLSLFLDSPETALIHVDWYSQSILLLYLFFPLVFQLNKRIASKKFSIEAIFLLLLILIARLPIYTQSQYLFISRWPILFLASVTYFHLKQNDYATIIKLSLLSILVGSLLFNLYLLLSLGVFAVVLLICSVDITLPFNKALSFLGKHSYEIYLAQNVWTYYFIHTKRFDSPYVLTAICLVGTIITAIVIYFAGKVLSKLFPKN